MSGRVGVELDATAIRGVRLDGWRGRPPRVIEAPWDPEHPDDGVQLLRETLGRAHRVAVAVRLPLLLPKRVRLPPLPPAERARVLRVEPQRFFPLGPVSVVVAAGRDDLVFAANEESLIAWTRALDRIGPVDIVEPGPVALARALAGGGITEARAVLDDAERGVGVVDIRDGGVANARRLYGTFVDAAPVLAATTHPLYLTPWDDARAQLLAAHRSEHTIAPLPSVRGVPAPFLSAYGAALATGRDRGGSLVPDELGAYIVARRRRDLGVKGVACVAAVVFALTSVDAWRERTVRRTDTSVQALTTRAAPVIALRDTLAALRQQSDAVARIDAERPDPLAVLLVLSRRLPAGAHVRSVGFSGAEWQIDGYASQAAEVIQSLGAASELADVHFLSATNRAHINDRTYESFSLAFRFVPAP